MKDELYCEHICKNKYLHKYNNIYIYIEGTCKFD